MSIEKLDHYSVRTPDLQRAMTFYEHALGFVAGPRPSFKFPGAWLYRTSASGELVGTGIVHLIGTGPDAAAGLTDYLGDKASSPNAGCGAFDHIAFLATDIAQVYTRLKRHAIPFRERKVPNLELHQIFLEDPDGVTIELNYSMPEDISEADNNMRVTR